eukprot:1375677-Ditylum_brightwellii.AAC.1
MSLQTGKLIVRQDFDKLPAAHNVIKHVTELAPQQNSLPELVFYDQNQVPITEVDELDTAKDQLTG